MISSSSSYSKSKLVINDDKRVLFLFSCFLLLWNSCVVVHGKITSGEFQFTPDKTDHVLSNFAIGGLNKYGEYDVVLTSPGANHSGGSRFRNDPTVKYFDPENNDLYFVLIPDTIFPFYEDTLTCKKKMRFIFERKKVEFTYNVATKQYESILRNQSLDQDRFIKRMNYHQHFKNRPYYWYFAITDCKNEQTLQETLQQSQGKSTQGQAMPKIKYEMKMYNVLFKDDEQRTNYIHNRRIAADGGTPVDMSDSIVKTHLSSDEFRVDHVHSLCFYISGILIIYLIYHILYTIKTTSNIHITKFIILLAAIMECVSAYTAYAHIHIYILDGIGSNVLDTISAHTEAICDSILALLLLTTACGYTLPSDCFKYTDINQNYIHSVISNFASSGVNNMMAFTIIVVHVVLAQWGHISNNKNIDSYHDYEHLPGKLLMVIRFSLGILMISACINTKHKCNIIYLYPFYDKLGVLGTLWFLSVPILVFLSSYDNIIPYYLRHNFVLIATSLIQSTYLILIAFLLTTSSRATRFIMGNSCAYYHKLSHISQSHESLSENGGGSASSMFRNLGSPRKGRRGDHSGMILPLTSTPTQPLSNGIHNTKSFESNYSGGGAGRSVDSGYPGFYSGDRRGRRDVGSSSLVGTSLEVYSGCSGGAGGSLDGSTHGPGKTRRFGVPARTRSGEQLRAGDLITYTMPERNRGAQIRRVRSGDGSDFNHLSSNTPTGTPSSSFEETTQQPMSRRGKSLSPTPPPRQQQRSSSPKKSSFWNFGSTKIRLD